MEKEEFGVKIQVSKVLAEGSRALVSGLLPEEGR